MRKEGKTWLKIKECAHKKIKKWLEKGQEVEKNNLCKIQTRKKEANREILLENTGGRGENNL